MPRKSIYKDYILLAIYQLNQHKEFIKIKEIAIELCGIKNNKSMDHSFIKYNLLQLEKEGKIIINKEKDSSKIIDLKIDSKGIEYINQNENSFSYLKLKQIFSSFGLSLDDK